MINPEQPDFDNTPASPQRAALTYSPAAPQLPPAVSIVTPFYNIEPDIFAETAQAVRRQTLQQWEWLIVNDGSSQPETLHLPIDLARQDPRIKIIDLPENRGLSAARNAGLQAARADYAVLLDGDDLLEPTAVEKWLWFLFTRPQLGFTRGYSVRFGQTPHLWSRSFEQIEAFLTRNQMEPTAMIRREVWRQTGGFDETMRRGLEDWDFWLKCAANGFWGATVPEYLNWYRLRPQQPQRWPALKNDETRLATRDELRQRYPRLFAGQLPVAEVTTPAPSLVSWSAPCANTLARPDGVRRILLIAATPEAALQANLIEPLLASAQLSLCATLPGQPAGMAQAAHFTPDVFVLPNFLQPHDYPRFLAYLAASRQVDGVLVAHGSPLAQVKTHPNWGLLLSSLQPGCAAPDSGEAIADLLATPAVESQPAGDGIAARLANDLSGEELAGLLSGQKLLKALGFKLGNQRGFRWLYRLKALGKRLVGDR